MMAKKIEVPTKLLVSYRKSDGYSAKADFTIFITVSDAISKDPSAILDKAITLNGVIYTMRMYNEPTLFFQLEVIGSPRDKAAQERACRLGSKVLGSLGFKPKGKISIEHKALN